MLFLGHMKVCFGRGSVRFVYHGLCALKCWRGKGCCRVCLLFLYGDGARFIHSDLQLRRVAVKSSALGAPAAAAGDNYVSEGLRLSVGLKSLIDSTIIQFTC